MSFFGAFRPSVAASEPRASASPSAAVQATSASSANPFGVAAAAPAATPSRPGGDAVSMQIVQLRQDVFNQISSARQDEEGVILVTSRVMNSRRFSIPPSDFGDAAGQELIDLVLRRLDVIISNYTQSLQEAEPNAVLQAELDKRLHIMQSRKDYFEASIARYRQHLEQDIDQMRRQFLGTITTLEDQVQQAAESLVRSSTPGAAPQDLVVREVMAVDQQLSPDFRAQLQEYESQMLDLKKSLAECGRFELRYDQIKRRIRETEGNIDTLKSYISNLEAKVSLIKSMCPEQSSAAAAAAAVIIPLPAAAAAPAATPSPRRAPRAQGRASEPRAAQLEVLVAPDAETEEDEAPVATDDNDVLEDDDEQTPPQRRTGIVGRIFGGLLGRRRPRED